MNYKISVIDDSRADAEYVAGLAARWAQSAGHTLGISLFPSAEAFLFQYEDEQNFDILLPVLTVVSTWVRSSFS